ncbi:DNA-3-methyladenine glycosylase 2 family protein [bacterium]|nr:DNA-3-methyladenine glycosylase 2 family protein [bacterium]
MTAPGAGLRAAERHLARADPLLGALIRRVGPCGLSLDKEMFTGLARIIVSQQLSAAAANTIFGRLATEFGEPLPAPALAGAGQPRLRALGLSATKAKAITLVAAGVADGALNLAALAQGGEDEARAALTALYGVGPWSAEMFMIFHMGLPDVLATGDAGLCRAAKRLHGLAAPPSAAQFTALAEPWRPWRSVASWYLWHLVDEPV